MIKSIAIEVTNNAFLPESYAYRDFFRGQDYQCELVEKGASSALDYDAIILFHGFHPFWKKYPKFVIGEYHSLSVGRYSRFKDALKRLLNVRSDLYIFLNEDVRKKLWFSKRTNYITRCMGYSKSDFERFKNNKKLFDVVYCGSYRLGLWDELKRLADLGLKIAVVGSDVPFLHPKLTSFGRKSPQEAREIISQSRLGLNYTPDISPLNIQDSTKVIEYCAAGLGVITNRYQWVNDFEKERSATFLSLDDIDSIDDINNYKFIIPDVSDLSWDVIMSSCGIKCRIAQLNNVEI